MVIPHKDNKIFEKKKDKSCNSSRAQFPHYYHFGPHKVSVVSFQPINIFLLARKIFPWSALEFTLTRSIIRLLNMSYGIINGLS